MKYLNSIVLLLSALIFFSHSYALELENPSFEDEQFIYIASEKDGKTNAVITCVKEQNGCLTKDGKVSIQQFVLSKKFKRIYEYRTMTFSNVDHFVITVSK